MFVRRERGRSLDADHERTRQLVADVRENGEPGLRVWRPPEHVSFGRRDRNEPGFERARSLAAERGYPTSVRETGGRAIVHTEGTLAVVLVTPTNGRRDGIEARYGDGIEVLRSALQRRGVDAKPGEPPNSFCPGSHSLQVDGDDGVARKVVGLAQRVRQEVAMLAGIVVVCDEETFAGALSPVYDALGVPFDPDSVGSVASARGDADPGFIGDGDPGSIGDSDPGSIGDAVVNSFLENDE